MYSSTRELIIREVHGGSLAAHFGEKKFLIKARGHYYWPNMSKDIQDVLRRCATYQVAKSHLLSHGIYTPLPVSTMPWVDITMDFILGLPKTQRNKDYIC